MGTSHSNDKSFHFFPHTDQNSQESHKKQKDDFFTFLKNENEPLLSSSFFSENGLHQDILLVTGAKPDIALEVFYALYNKLLPQIEKQSDASFRDAWIKFIGGSIYKGGLCPPEKLLTERMVKDIRENLSHSAGESYIFQNFDRVADSVATLKKKCRDYSGQLLNIDEIIESLDRLQDFYLDFRKHVKTLVQAIIEKQKMNAPYTLEYEALDDLLEPKAIIMSDIFSHHWAFRISRNTARKLLSTGRKIQRTPSNYRVTALPENTETPLVYFKANGNPPIQPEKEFMLYSLYRHLQIPVPETALLILTDVFEANPHYFYAVQASEAVIGESPRKAYRDAEKIFNHEAYVSQVIGAFLTNPADGSLKNFKYSPKYETLISIDNDIAFEPELRVKGSEKSVNVKSILYFMPEIDQKIPESTKTFFGTLDPHLIILLWLQDLSQKNQEFELLFSRLPFQKTRCMYQNLLPHSKVSSLEACLQKGFFVDADLPSDTFYPQMHVSQNLITSLVEKLQIIKKTLQNDSLINTQALFEEISPALGKFYRNLRLKSSNPEAALEALWGNKKDGAEYSYILSLLDSEEFSTLSKNIINHQNNIGSLPEVFLEEYKSILVSTHSSLDSFIMRHNQRRKRNVLNLQGTLSELRLLIQEGVIDSQSITDIVDFCYNISQIKNDQHMIQEIISLFSHLPHPELKWLLTLEKCFVREGCETLKDLFPFSLKVDGAFMKQRTFVLTKSEKKYLFDKQGNIKKNKFLTWGSSVTYFPKENSQFYLKPYPKFPGYEFASTLFMRLLGIQHLPYHDFLIIDSKYPTLLTQKIHGQPILRIQHDPQAFSNLDPLHTGLLIISAMLLNPESGKEDNFILSEDKKFLIPINNHHCFLPGICQREEKFWNTFTVNTALQTLTILFCFDEMQLNIPPEVRNHLLSIDFDKLLIQWMNEIAAIEVQCKNLVNQDQQNRFLEYGTAMGTTFYTQFIENIYWKVHKIQTMLRNTSKLTPFDLLKVIEPFAAKYYQKSFKTMNSLQNRFNEATNQLETKTLFGERRVSLLNSQTMMEIINMPVKTIQNDEKALKKIGPLDALKLLNQLIQKRRQEIQIKQEMFYEFDDRTQETKWRNLFGNPRVETALKEFFSNPKAGLILKGSKLITSGRLSKLFSDSPCAGEKIKYLSLLNCPLLSSQEIRIFAEKCPNLQYLDVSGSSKLKEIILGEKEWPLLAGLEAMECYALKKMVSYSPIRVLRLGTANSIHIFVEKPRLDIFTILLKAKKFELAFRRGKQLKIKFQGEKISNNDFLLGAIPKKEEIAEYFRDWIIKIGTKEFIFTAPWSKVFQLLFQLDSHLNSLCSAEEKALSSDFSWDHPSLLDASQSEIPCSLDSSLISLPMEVNNNNINNEVPKARTEDPSLPLLIELDVNENIGVEGANSFMSNFLNNHRQYLNLRMDEISDLQKQVPNKGLEWIVSSEQDFNINCNGDSRKAESSENTPQTNNLHNVECKTKITCESIKREKAQFHSLEDVGLSRETPDESAQKTNSIAQEESLSRSQILFNFVKTQAKNWSWKNKNAN